MTAVGMQSLYDLESLDDRQLQAMFLRVAHVNDRYALGYKVKLDVALEEKLRGLPHSDTAATHQRQADGYRAFRIQVIRNFEEEHQCSVYPRGLEFSDQERWDEYIRRTGDTTGVPLEFRSLNPQLSRTADERYARFGYVSGFRFFTSSNYPVRCDDAIL